MNAKPDDYQLALQAQQGDQNALADLVERTRLRLFALAYADLGHYQDAQDAVASALLRICLHIQELRDPATVQRWMRAIVRNETRALRRQRRPEVTALSDVAALTDGEVPTVLRLDIERALRRLPGDQARAVVLFYLGGLPIREIARRAGRPEGTVKSWLHHGRRRLSEQMGDYAPMNGPWDAAIVGSDWDEEALERMIRGIRAAGYREVHLVRDFRDLCRFDAKDSRFHLSAPLAGSRFVLLDETVAGRSTLELFPALRSTPEGKNATFCLLMGRTQHKATDDLLVLSAYIAGVDMYLTKPFNPEEVGRFAQRARETTGD